MKVLVVEDEAMLLKSITTYLHRSNYICDEAVQFYEAKENLLLLADFTLIQHNRWWGLEYPTACER